MNCSLARLRISEAGAEFRLRLERQSAKQIGCRSPATERKTPPVKDRGLRPSHTVLRRNPRAGYSDPQCVPGAGVHRIVQKDMSPSAAWPMRLAVSHGSRASRHASTASSYDLMGVRMRERRACEPPRSRCSMWGTSRLTAADQIAELVSGFTNAQSERTVRS